MPHLPHLKSFLLASIITALTLSPAWIGLIPTLLLVGFAEELF